MHISKSLHIRQVVIACLVAFAFPATVAPVWAQSPPEQTIQDTQIIFNDPTPPDKGSPSGRRRGGASRGPCRQFESLTALVPATKGVVWGQTISDRPTFWFYLPQALTAQTPLEFTVQDPADREIYSSRFTAANTKPGFIQLQLPATTTPLKVGQSYTWTLSVYCDPAKPSSAVFVKGTIQRTALEPTVQKRLKTLSPLEQARVYAASGIWYDALNTLAVLHNRQPGDRQLTALWQTLLKQADLEDASIASFSSCCTLQP